MRLHGPVPGHRLASGREAPRAEDVVDGALCGRRAELAALERMLAAVRAGESRALVLRGEPGVGKTALLRQAASTASGFGVARVGGVEAETELAFAGLHQLCAPMLGLAERLPAAQRNALQTALGLREGAVPDRFLIGLAVLGLLAEAARERPLVCLVDDVQWLDQVSVQALAFAARRLGAESVAVIFAARTAPRLPGLAGLPELEVRGLPEADARRLLRTVLPGPVDERVRDRLLAESRGIPLALLELRRGLSPVELVGYGPPLTGPPAGRIEAAYLQRLASLPAATRRLLLVAAADPVGEPAVVWRAAQRLGIGIAASEPAGTAGFIETDGTVRFHHPLVRSAFYWAASPAERRRTHRVLAEVTDPGTDPDRRAWHAAYASASPDEALAADLERSAAQARRRGGPAAAAAFLARATELTPDLERRGERALDGARAMHEAGSPDGALRLLSIAEAAPLSRTAGAHVQLLQAQVAVTARRGNDAPGSLVAAARRLEPLDVALARETYLEALSAAMFDSDVTGTGVREVAAAARLAPRPAGRPRAVDLLLDGLAIRVTDGYAAGCPVLEEALRVFGEDTSPPADRMRWLWMATTVAAELWDDAAWERLATEYVQLARDDGALSLLPLALSSLQGLYVATGELARAAVVLEELAAVLTAAGRDIVPGGALLCAAWRGDANGFHELGEAVEQQSTWLAASLTVLVAWARGTFHNGLGRYDDAVLATADIGDPAGHLSAMVPGALVELVEAAGRSDRRDRAAQALAWLTPAMRASGTDWALGLEARCRALLGGAAADAEDLHREAVERLGRTRVRGEAARARLVYGEWLRRAQRRRDAHVQLRAAHEEFVAMGMGGFAHRAARELRATGANVRVRRAPARSELTPQQTQIVRLVRDGLSNPEVGARLFLSPRTVEWHLRRIYAKLGVSSRKELLQR